MVKGKFKINVSNTYFYIYWASSELAPNMFGASSEPANVMEFVFKQWLKL